MTAVLRLTAMLAAAMAVTVSLAEAAAPTDSAEQSASQAFDEGLAAFTCQDHEAAARSFEQSFALSGHPFAAYNAALAWRRLPGASAREADALWRSLARPGLEPAQARLASARLAVLRTQLAFIEARAVLGSVLSLPDGRKLTLPTSFHLTAGRHELRARDLTGREVVRVIDAVTGEATPVDLQPPPSAPTVEQPSVEADSDAPPDLALGGWICFALGAALGGGAVGLGVATLDARDSFDAGGQVSQSLHDRATSLRVATNVVAFSGAALAATGVVLLVVSAVSDDGAAVTAKPDGSLAFRF